MLMSAARARGTRRPQLEADVAADARCGPKNPDAEEAELQLGDWFREDSETTSSWVIRRQGLMQHCADCPVLAQCRELALRYDADRGREDDMVRGGLTARTLATTARTQRHARSLARAKRADKAPGQTAAAADQQRARIATLTTQLRDAAARRPHTDRQSGDALIEHATTELAALRNTRRTQTGWRQAA